MEAGDLAGMGEGVARQGNWHKLRNTIFPTARSLVIRSSLDRLSLKHFESVLIIGAGEDPYRRLFGTPKRYLTLDLVNYPGSTDVVGNAHRLPFAGDSFDCLFAAEVVEHLSGPHNFVSEARRVLVPGGQIVFTVPFMFHTHADPNDYWRLTREGFHQILSEFSSVKVYAQGNRLHVLSDLLTTSFSPTPLLFPLRILNHVFRLLDLNNRATDSTSSAPSGFLVIAKK